MSYTTILIRRDPAATWSVNNPILSQGELGFELDTGKGKLGDGIRAWNNLPYTITKDWNDLLNTPTGTTSTASYTWVRYASDSSGTGITTTATGNDYIGLAYNKSTPGGTENPADYTWTIYGSAIDSLSSGTGTGTGTGAETSSSYTWVRYALDASGTGITTNPTNMGYIGVAYNKSTPGGTETPTDYTWTIYGSALIEMEGTIETSGTGSPGTVGPAGPEGARNASVYIYYSTPQATPPTQPSLAQISYNFDTMVVTAAAAGWNTEFTPSTIADDNTGNNIYWACRVTFQETAFEGPVTTIVSPVFMWINFDGLVTFTNLASGTNINGSNSTTLIDGGSIKTGTISATKITAGSITSTQLSSNSVTAAKIAAGAITVDKISSGSTNIVGGKFSLGSTSKISVYEGVGVFESNSTKAGLLAAGGSSGIGIGIGTYGTSTAGAYAVHSTSSAYTTHNTHGILAMRTLGGSFYNGNLSTSNPATGCDLATSINSAYLSGPIGPFTASHDGIVNEADVFDLGDIMIDDTVFAVKDVSDTITNVVISSVAQERGPIGIYAGDAPDHIPVSISLYVPATEQQPPTRIIDPQYTDALVGKKFVIINSLGEGLVNVCGENGNIQKGDLIVTSSIPGKGMKQTDDIVRSITVAKSRENVTFASPSEVKQLACIYLCG